MKKIVSVLILSAIICVNGFAQKQNTNTAGNNTKTQDASATNKQQGATNENAAKPKPKTPPKDGYAVSKEMRDTTSEKAFLPVIKDEDVIYTKRVWRDIDLRDTINGVLNYPKARLIDIILEHVKRGELTAYNPKSMVNVLDDDDAFNFPLDTAEALKKAYGTSQVQNKKEGTVKEVKNTDINYDLFLKYRIKEDWVLDGKRGVFEPRIIGLAPLRMNDKTKNWEPVFWIYYEEARDVLATKRLFNPLNDSSPISMDDFFIHRLFSSHIIKETNTGDAKVSDLIKDPRQRLLESERIKKKMADMEQGLWEY